MFCPKCKTEYRAALSICPNCGADLGNPPPVPSADLSESRTEPVVLRTYVNSVEAEIAAAALDSVGIESTIRSDDSAEEGFARSQPRNIQLLVRPEDADAANDFLDVEGIEGRDASE